MTILVLCREHNLCKELWGYARAFQRHGVRLVCVEEDTLLNVDVRRLLQACPERPSLILQPESDFPLLPWGLTEMDIPTACFQFDTYAYTRRRIRWSMLFDYVCLFHPGFEEHFRSAGHTRPLALSHAAARELFEGPEEERVFEVGWVGRADRRIYESRRRVLGELAKHFRMNDWQEFRSPEEMSQIYKQSRIVVNVGRDDYPQDANMRVFEVMAAGALLITRLPSELTTIGFEDGVHFVGYREESEIVERVRTYLADETARARIAQAGREKVLREHTYDCRVETLLERLHQDGGRLFAPAREWSEERVRLIYLDYHAAHLSMDCAHRELRQIARRSLRNALAGASLIARAWARQSRGRVLARVLHRS